MTQVYAFRPDATPSERTVTVLLRRPRPTEATVKAFPTTAPNEVIVDLSAQVSSGSSFSGQLTVIPPLSRRDQIRAKLAAANFLVTSIPTPENLAPLTPDELLEIGRLPLGTLSVQEMIDEERGQY
jgi:hypothetical protein